MTENVEVCKVDMDFEREIEMDSNQIPVQNSVSSIERNPLLIHLVTNNLFSWEWSVKDLLQLRQVCRLWDEAAFSYLLPAFDESEINFSAKDAQDPTKMDEFIKMLEGNSDLLFKKFSFSDLGSPSVLYILETSGQNITQLKLFWESLTVIKSEDSDDEDADPISEFDLSDFDDSWTSNASSTDENNVGATPGQSRWHNQGHNNSQLLYNILFVSCPNLKHLALGNIPESVKNSGIFESRERKETGITRIDIRQDCCKPFYNSIFFRDLFGSCPHLSEVNLEANYDSYTLDKRLLSALADTGRIENLISLQVNSVLRAVKVVWPDPGPSSLYSNLKKLTMSSFDSIKWIHFEYLMVSISSTLTNLKLENMYNFNAEGLSMTFPVMEKLEKLKVGIPFLRHPGGDSRVHIPSFGNISYSYQFPKLKTLKIKEDSKNLILSEWFYPLQNEHTVLEKLEIPASVTDLSIFKLITEIFPNLLKFKYGQFIQPGFPSNFGNVINNDGKECVNDFHL